MIARKYPSLLHAIACRTLSRTEQKWSFLCADSLSVQALYACSSDSVPNSQVMRSIDDLVQQIDLFFGDSIEKTRVILRQPNNLTFGSAELRHGLAHSSSRFFVQGSSLSVVHISALLSPPSRTCYSDDTDQSIRFLIHHSTRLFILIMLHV